ncbi:MAG: 50S ribosomal protein L29 [Polyangiaceae bacterium]|nr:50S ribosomal protein L29 [Polyangiaceae bacterium]
MKSKELREKSIDELLAHEKALYARLFESRLKNQTNRLDDTSSLPKTRREIARVKTLLAEKQKKS